MNTFLSRPIAILNKFKNLNNVMLNKKPIKQTISLNRPIVRFNQTDQTTATLTNDIAYLNKLVQENKIKNILVYSCKSDGSIRVNLIGFIGFCFLSGASYFSFLVFGAFKYQNTRKNESGFFGNILNIMASEYFRYSVCFATVAVGFAMFIVSLASTARSVNKLYLLKGGRSLGVVTDGIFGRDFKYTLTLEETSFNQTRLMPDKRVPQIWFKNKKHFFYFLLNNIEGQFHEKFLFDRVICAKRLD